MYAFGEHQALGFSPFAIDQASPKETESVSQAYNLLRQINSLTSHHSPLTSHGLLFDQDDKERIIENDGMVITCRHYFTLPWDARATDGTTWPEGGAILMKLADNEYLLAGTGVVVTFSSAYEKTHERLRVGEQGSGIQQQVLGEDGFVATGTPSDIKHQPSNIFKGFRKGIASVDEVSIDEEGQMHYQRRQNGDQDHQGRHVRIACGEWKILHVKLYDYK